MSYFEQPIYKNYKHWMYKVFYIINGTKEFISWDGKKENLEDGTRSLVILNKHLSPEYYPSDKRDRYWTGSEGEFTVTVDGVSMRISSISTIHRVSGYGYKIHINEFRDDRLYRNNGNNCCYFYMDRDDLEDHKKRYDNEAKGLVLGVDSLVDFVQLFPSRGGGRKKRTQTRTRKLTRTRTRTRRQKRTTRIMRLPRNLPRRRFDLL